MAEDYSGVGPATLTVDRLQSRKLSADHLITPPSVSPILLSTVPKPGYDASYQEAFDDAYVIP